LRKKVFLLFLLIHLSEDQSPFLISLIYRTFCESHAKAAMHNTLHSEYTVFWTNLAKARAFLNLSTYHASTKFLFSTFTLEVLLRLKRSKDFHFLIAFFSLAFLFYVTSSFGRNRGKGEAKWINEISWLALHLRAHVKSRAYESTLLLLLCNGLWMNWCIPVLVLRVLHYCVLPSYVFFSSATVSLLSSFHLPQVIPFEVKFHSSPLVITNIIWQL